MKKGLPVLAEKACTTKPLKLQFPQRLFLDLSLDLSDNPPRMTSLPTLMSKMRILTIIQAK